MYSINFLIHIDLYLVDQSVEYYLVKLLMSLGTSNDTAVQLTFRYSANVSSFIDATGYICTCNYMMACTRITIYWYVHSGTFPSMEEGLYS